MKNRLYGMLVEVMGSDFTLNGVTSGKTRAILVGKGIPEIFEVDDEYPALTLVPGYGKQRSLMAVPVNEDGKPKVGRPMFGGHFIYSSDSRFTQISDQPVHVMDRFE